MESNTFFDKIGGRKLVMSILSLAVGIVLELYSKNGLSANMLTLIGALYATYAGTNTLITNKALGGSGASAASEAPAAAAVKSLESKMDTQASQLAAILNQIGSELAKGQEQQLIIQQSLLTMQKSISTMLRNNS